MKPLIKITLCTIFVAFALVCQNIKAQPDTTETKIDKEKLSYAIGVNIAQSMKDISDEIDLSMLQKGITDKFQGKETMSDEEVKSLLQAFSKKLKAKEQEMIAKAAQKNLEVGQAFLKENKTKDGVVTTKSGLQYKVLKKGQGKSPIKSDSVKVHYKGTKLDGTEFDSSYKRGQPITFQADRVIKGWTEGLQLMKEGGKYMLFIPAALGYGVNGAGQMIGPNEVLIFEVELLEVINPKTSESKPSKEQKTNKK